MASTTSLQWNTFLLFISLVCQPDYTRAITADVVVSTRRHNAIHLIITASDNSNVKLSTSAMLNPGTTAASPLTPVVGTAGTSIGATWSNLTPDTKYTVVLTSLLDANDGPLLDPTYSDAAGTYTRDLCTLPEIIAVAQVENDGSTTATQVKISWTNPTTSFGGVKLVRGSTTEVITDPTVSEYVFTGLTASDTATCSVITKGSDDCSSEEAETPYDISSCDTKHTTLEVDETITTDKITLVYTLANGAEFTIASNALTQSATSVPGAGANDATTAAATHTLIWDSLTANTRYDLALGDVVDTDNSNKNVQSTANLNFCTKPEAATTASDEGIVEATTNEITIKWTNPSSLGGIKVSWGNDFETTLTDTALTEYTFKESAPGTNLVAGQSGTCKIYIMGSGNCAASESDVLEIVDCNTKSFVTRSKLSLGLLVSNLLWGIYR